MQTLPIPWMTATIQRLPDREDRCEHGDGE